MVKKLHLHLPSTVRQIFHLICLLCALIFFRLCQLTYFDQEKYIEIAETPKRKTLLKKAKRGEILDRNGTPLACNELSYQASLYFSEIAQIPAVQWVFGPEKTKVKTYPRKEYIEKLAQKLSQELGLEKKRLEDAIYSYAALFPHLPYKIKTNLSEKEYYRIKMLEKDCPGLQGEVGEKRVYPQGKIACNVVGYMGALNCQEYFRMAEKIKMLSQYVESPDLPLPKEYQNLESLLFHLKEIREKAYSFQDLVGKTGVEAFYERELRGFSGKEIFETNPKGNFLKKLPQKYPPLPGKKVVLSLSLPLQKKAESLLAQKALRTSQNKKQKMPWIKGGSIIAMDPNTGEIFAFASYPRYDPNDFLSSSKNAQKWLETESHIGKIWEGKALLEREIYDPQKDLFFEETLPLTWETFLNQILSTQSPILSLLKSFSVKQAAELQEDWERVLFHLQEKDSYRAMQVFSSLQKPSFLEEFEKKWPLLFSQILEEKDRIFAIDLCRLFVFSPAFSNELLEKVGSLSIQDFFVLHQQILQLKSQLKEKAKQGFHKTLFPLWREKNQNLFLEEKREEERRKGSYAHPFLDLLDQKESSLFQTFYHNHLLSLFFHVCKKKPLPQDIAFLADSLSDINPCQPLLFWAEKLSASLLQELFQSARFFSELQRPLLHHYSYFSHKNHPVEKDLAASFYPSKKGGYTRSYTHRQACTLGSIFKLVTTYAALKEHYEKTKEPFSFTLIDQITKDPKKGLVVGYTSKDKTALTRIYKQGRLPKSSRKNIGEIDLIKALEQSSNPYFSLLALSLKDPSSLKETAKELGFGVKTGIDLPGEISGILPKDLSYNRSGLYSFAIGHHQFSATPLQTAVMLSTLAKEGTMFRPKIAKAILGKKRSIPSPLSKVQNYPYKKTLDSLKIPFSLFSQPCQEEQTALLLPYEIKRKLFFPKEISYLLHKGMDACVWGEKGTANFTLLRPLLKKPSLIKQYACLKHRLIGKTSTSEIMANLSVNPSSKAEKYKHVWFGSILFEEGSSEKWKRPELVVVVYLEFEKSGKEAAFLAIQMIEAYQKLQRDKKASSSFSFSEEFCKEEVK